MLNPTYQSILNLLIAYEQQLTLSKDEFDAVDYYQRAGYRLYMSEIFYGDYPIPDTPKGCLASQIAEQSKGLKVVYFLFKEDES